MRWIILQELAPLLDKILVTIVAKEHNMTASYPTNTKAITINNLVPSLSYNISVVAAHNSSKITSPPTTVRITMPDCQGMSMYM